MAGQVYSRCQSDTPFTGYSPCATGEALTSALLFHDVRAKYPSDPEEFNTLLPELVYATDLSRIYPVTDIQSVDITGGDTNTSDVGSGYNAPTNKSQVVATYTLQNDDCLYKQLRKMEGIDWRVFRIDQNGAIYGTIVRGDFVGFKCRVSVRRIQATGTDQAYLYVEVYYSAQYESELLNLHSFEIGTENIPVGLVAVVVVAVTTPAGGSKVVGQCSQADYTAEFNTQWTAPMFIQSTGTAATSISYDANTQVLTITPAGTYRVADASVLHAGGIEGITGVPL